MKGDAELLDRIRELATSAVDATVVRILPTGIPPDRENILGARWNPRGTPAIYTAFEAPTARAEIAFRIGLEPVPMKDISRTEYRIEVRLQQVVNLTADAPSGEP